MFYFSSLPLSEASPLPSTVHVYINEASWGYHKWKIAQKKYHTCPTPEKNTEKKNSLKPWTWCQVNGYGYIKLYHILHGFPQAPMGRSRTQPHMPTPQGFPKKCPHLQLRALLDKRSTTDEERPGVLFSNFRWYKRHPKFFLVSEFPAIKTPKDLLTQDQETCCFFPKSMLYIQKPKRTESPTWCMSTTCHLGQGADPLVQHGGWNLKSSKGGAWMKSRWSVEAETSLKNQTSK